MYQFFNLILIKRLVVFNIFIICFYFLSFFCHFFISYYFAHFLVFTVTLEKYCGRNIYFVLNVYPFLNLGIKIEKFLYPSHASFPDLGRPNFCIPLQLRFQIWDGQNLLSLSCFFSRFRIGKFLYPPLTKIAKYLYPSEASFPDLGWVNFCIPLRLFQI